MRSECWRRWRWVAFFAKGHLLTVPSLSLGDNPPRQHHHFYVEEKTKRSIWIHPYDDPVFLESLPDTHPANPNSAEARAARAHAEEMKKQHEEAIKSTEGEEGPGKGKAVHRNFAQRMKDKAIGTKEERKELKRQRAEQDRVSGRMCSCIVTCCRHCTEILFSLLLPENARSLHRSQEGIARTTAQ